MSSSTSSSDDTASAPHWRAWLWTFAWVPVGFAAICALTIMLDPYSTGRFTPFTRIDLATRNDVLGHSARSRDTAFNAGIAGDSNALPLEPARLSAATGLRFAQLSGLGLSPGEQLLIARNFIRNRRQQAPALVIMLDRSWCEADEAHNRISGIFPTFVFESSNFEYLKNMISSFATEAAGYRILMLLGLAGDRRRRDGYAPIIFPEQWTAEQWTAEQLVELRTVFGPSAGPAADAPLPALNALQMLAREFDPQTPLVLFFSPTPSFRLPVTGSAAAKRLDYCKARFREFAAARPHTALIDRLVDGEFAHDMRNFGDSLHAHNRAAPVLEQNIAAALVPMLPR